MAEVLVGAVVDVLVEKLSSAALLNFAESQGIDHPQLEDWKKTLPLFQAVLADAGQKEITIQAVKVWLDDLQELAYDIDDVLDDIATEVMKRKLNDDASTNTRSSKLLKTVQTCFSHFARNLKYGRTMSSKLDEITSKLKNLYDQKQVLGLVENRKVDISNRTTTSSVNVSKVLGREEDKQVLIGKLLGNEEACGNQNMIGVLSIVGIGGLGKTTLVQLLYNDQRVKDHFELMAWVCVSNEFDVVNISKAIYQAVGGDDRHFVTLDLLHAALKEKLSKKRFLVVLDDVWNEDHNKWYLLRSAFDVGADGSKFLVTTRKEEVALVMDSLQPYMLEVLSEEISMSLLAQSTLDEQNFDEHPSLKVIAQGIVKKCDGLPLALIALGRVLKRKGSDDEWEELLNSDIWNSDNKSGILPALKLSYYDLPSHLKQLFAYCSLFPKGYEFKKKKVVLLWMAQGFLSQRKGNNQPMEILGGKYFEELLSRSFFQPLGKDESRYIMHDLMNDLATSVAGEFFFRLDKNMDLNGSNEAYEKFHYFSFIGQRVPEYKNFKELHRARCLRTFLHVLGGWGSFYTLDNVIAELFPHIHFLRVLSLTNWSITKVPQSIGNFKHLRYLNFSKTNILQIPEQVSELYNLQSLLVHGCRKLCSLPTSFVKLINLRHLDMSHTPSLKKLPLGIDGLTSLRTLSKVVIQEDNGFKLFNLKGLKDLQGELSIEGLEKVIDPTEAKDANLQQKKGLDDLKLVWGDAFRYTTNEDDIIEMLRPHSKLKIVSINGYKGMKFPSWLGDRSFDRLKELVLNECNNCRELATLELLTSLQKLEVLKCSRLVSINKGEKEVVNVGIGIMGSLRQVRFGDCHSLESYCCPTSVERLVIEDCDSLTSLSYSKLQKDLPLSSSSSSSNLKFLTIKNCKNIKSIGEKDLDIHSIMGSLQQVTLLNCVALESYCCPHSVERLDIQCCSAMTSLTFSKLHEGDLPSSPSNLKTLLIRDCKNIKSISQEHLLNLTYMVDMVVVDCPSMEDSFPSSGLWPSNLRKLGIGELKKPISQWGLQNYPPSLVELFLYGRNSRVVSFGMEEQDYNNMSSSCFLLPPSLTSLSIWDFEEVESVSEVLQHLPRLQHLQIGNCPKLRDVPETTSSLRVLWIRQF